jgi:type I restriction enzyme S subunit
MWAWMGALGVSPVKGIVSPAYGVYRPFGEVYPRFLDLLLRIPQYIAEYIRRSTGIHSSRLRLYPDQFLDIPLLLPPLDEQKRIVEFLDRKTAEIDEAIAQKQRLIELLQEQKAILINQAVTKGLNPNAPMQNSGIEWIGKVPKHWSIKRAKQVCSIFVPQRNKPELNPSIGIPWVTTEDLVNQEVSKSESGYFVSSIHAKQAGSRVLPKNSVIASCVGSFGVASVNSQPVIINQQLQAFIPRSINPWYLRYTILTSKSYFELNSTSTTLAYVNQEGFAEMPLPCPPDVEQREIFDFLDYKMTEVEDVIKKIERQIGNIQEFRQILISQAVTGKIKV